MGNYHTVEILNTYKNQILNHLGKNLFLCFMTNKPFPNNQQVDLVRKNHGHAHIRYQTWEELNNFRNYNDYKYLYVTSSLFEVDNTLCLTLRKDLILSWSQTASYKETNVLILDTIHHKIAEVPCEFILRLYNSEKYFERLNVQFGTIYVAFDLELFSDFLKEMDNREYKGTSFKKEYWNPQFIGNTQYSIHRVDTKCRIRIYDKNGIRCICPESFKSLKEAFDTLSKIAAIGVTYKTFQRRSITHKPIITEKGSIILVSRESDNFDFPVCFDVSEIEIHDVVLGTQNKSNEEISEEEKIELKNSEKFIKEYMELCDSINIENEEIIDFEESISKDDFL